MESERPPLLNDNPRFLAPDGWQTGNFQNPETGHDLHFGHAAPAKPKAIVVALAGLSEFSEKYYELAHDMLDRGYAFWIMDWQYQGRSGRHPDTPKRRHSDGYDADLSDLNLFISQIIKPSLPMIMAGHSMGGNIGLRYLSEHPGVFIAAALSAPMIDIKGLGLYGPFLKPILSVMSIFKHEYVPGGRDWHESMRKSDGTDIFSSDAVRDQLHNAWCTLYPELQVGNPTIQWLDESVKSCEILQSKGTLEAINIPVLMAAAGKEKLVDNRALRKATARLPKGELLELPDSLHEILVERDDIRNQYLQSFDRMIQTHKIV